MLEAVLCKIVLHELMVANTLAKQKLLFYGNSQYLCSKTIKLAV